MKRFLFLSFAIALSSAKSFAQGEIPVDMYTGTPRIQIPLGGVAGHELGDGLSLVYNAHGVKLNQPAGHYGVGWELDGGGYVAREIRGLPDDYPVYGSDPRRGWLNTRQSKTMPVCQEIAGFGNTSDISTSTCSDELTDYNALYDFAGSAMDTQPDVFTFSVGGYSGKFVFDNSTTPQIRLIPYQDIKIEPIFSPSLYGFKITTNMGVVYSLTTKSSETRQTIKLTSKSKVEFRSNEFEPYCNYYGSTLFNYTTAWALTSVTAPGGDELIYNYGNDAMSINDTVKVAIKKKNIPGYVLEKLYLDQRTINRKYLTSIVCTKAAQTLQLNYNATTKLLTSVQLKDKRLSADQLTDVQVKEYLVDYLENGYGRDFLNSVREKSGTDEMPRYQLDYYLDYLPSRDSKGKDFWGYNNGKKNSHLAPTLYVYPNLPVAERYRIYPIPSYQGTYFVIPGADRNVDPLEIQKGTLKSISYPGGGAAMLEYEPNQYYDSIAGQNLNGPGLRIKKLVYDNGINAQSRIVKNFTYTDASGNSSGRLTDRPAFAIPVYEYRDAQSTYTIPYEVATELSFAADASSIWDYFTVRSEEDLNTPLDGIDATVGYKEVKVYRPGAGYAHFEFNMPATFGLNSSGSWSATQNKIARSASCLTMGVITTGGTFMFPYAPNPNLGYERGLVRRKREYNEAGTLVRESSTSYQYMYNTGTTPAKVNGLLYHRLANESGNAYLFGKYDILTGVSKLVASELVTTYNENNISKKITEKNEFFYGSTQHKLMTRLVRTAGDGTLYKTYLRYAPDYTIPSGSLDKASQMIGLMKTTSRYGAPVESYQTIQRPGDGEKVINGSVVSYHDFGTTDILPQKQLTWNASSSLAVSSFTPSFINSSTGTFTTHPSYETAATWLDYDVYGKVRSTRGIDSIAVTQIWGFNTTVPVVTVRGASAGQFAFSDFETATSVKFDIGLFFDGSQSNGNAEPLMYTPGRTGKWCTGISTLLSKTLTKAENTYKVSGWWNKKYPSMTVRATIKNAAQTVTYSVQTFNVVPGDADATFEYFEKEISIDPSLQTFYVELAFLPSGTATGDGMIDDVAFYPVSAQLSSATYRFPYGADSASHSDQTTYTVYDNLGRIKYVLDRNRNILQKNSYKYSSN